MKPACLVLVVLSGHAVAWPLAGQGRGGPDTVVVARGVLRLRALLWRPDGQGPFPAVLFNHGSRRTFEPQAATLGPVFARHGYCFLFLFRRGSGLSADQGVNSEDLLDRDLAAKGEDARNRLQVRLLETEHLGDALAGLTLLQALPEVDGRRLAVAGHSFGGSLTLLVAERDSALRAIVDFAGAAKSWDRSAPLRERLLAAPGRITAPVFIIHAANDYSVAPGRALGAELTRLGKPYRLKIYPPFGRTPGDGHRLVHLGVSTWEHDVFAFLDQYTRR